MTKVEKVFWFVLLFLAGAIIGAVAYAVLCPPHTTPKTTDCEKNGTSIQVTEDTIYTSYVPALDECPAV